VRREDDQGVYTVLKEQWKQTKRDARAINVIILAGLIFFGIVLGYLFPKAVTGIAGGTFALIIAFVAYPWQKGLDRENQLRLEQRKTYLEYVKGCNALMRTYRKMDYKALQSFTASSSSKLQHDELLIELMTVGRKEVVQAASELNNIIHDFLDSLATGLKALNKAPTVADIDKVVSAVLQETSPKYDVSMEKFVNLVRRLEFGDLDYVEFKSRHRSKGIRAD